MEQLWRPFVKENILDPYPMYKKLREQDPIHKSRTGEWVITRYEDAKTLLKEDRCKVGNRAEWLAKASTQQTAKLEIFSVAVEILRSFVVFKNPPDHTLLRKFIMQAWNSREVDEIILTNIDTILSRADLSNVEVVEELAAPLPAMTMTRILGLPMEDYQYLLGLSHQMIQSLDLYPTFRQIKEMEKATIEFVDYFEKHTARKRFNPDDGLLAKLVLLNEGNQISHQDLLANCFLLFIAGEETTSGLISLGLGHLISRNKLGSNFKDPSFRSTATDELLRFDSPAQLSVRIISEDMQMRDHEFKAGDTVLICLGAANRDPDKFELPDNLILDRTPNHHLAFASGIHRCLGDWLAKKEFELLTGNLVHRFRTFNLLEEPVRKENLNMRNYLSLHISFS